MLDVVQELAQTLSAHPGKAPRPELSGILLGNTGGITEIDAAIPCTKTGAGAIPAALRDLKPAGADRPVGFYRCQTEDSLQLTAQDLEIASAHFSHPRNVFLVIHLSPAGPRSATFFFWDGARIHADFAFLEFPFDVPSLVERERQRMADIDAEQNAPSDGSATPQPAPVALPAQGRGTAKASARPSRFGIAALVVGLVFLVAGAAWFTTRPKAPVQKAAVQPDLVTPLSLRLRLQGPDVLVSWDRDAAVRSGAETGVLTIRDGDREKVIGLNRAQVRGANVLISPESQQVQIELTLVLPDQRTLRDAGVALLATRQAGSQVQPQSKAQVQNSSQAGRRTRPASQSNADGEVAAVRWIHADDRPLAPAGEAERIHQPESAPASAPSSSLPPAQQRPASMLPLASQIPAATPVPAPSAAAAQSTQPATGQPATGQPAAGQPAAGQPAAGQPAVGQPAVAQQPAVRQPVAPTGGGNRPESATGDVNVVPARFLSGKSPRYPPAAFRAHVQGTVLVEAVVGPEGEVKQLRVISGPPPLREEALNAVRSGKFVPARIDGRPVTAPTRVEINFHGNW